MERPATPLGIEHTNATLRVLGDLSGASKPKTTIRRRIAGKNAEFVWEGERHLSCFVSEGNPSPSWIGQPPKAETVANRKRGDHLAALDALQPNDSILRLGWAWFSGQTTDNTGKKRSYCFPAVSVPVVLERSMRGRTVKPIDDPEISPLIENRELARILLEGAFYGLGEAASPEHENHSHPGFQAWANHFAIGVGLVVSEWAGPETSPFSRMNNVGLAAIAGAAIYVADPMPSWNRGLQLLDWSDNHQLGDTAFAAVYSGASPRLSAVSDAPIPPTRPLNETQRAVVVSSMRQGVTTVSGPPGTGKTHTVAEIALAAIARGESVLVGANSPHAVDVLRSHFINSPGPQPITFGGRRVDNPREQILDRLNSGADRKLESNQRERRDATVADRAQLAESISRMLAAESQVARLVGDPASRLDMEDRLERAGDIGALRDRLASYQDTGLIANLRRGGRRRELIRRFSLRDDADLAEFTTTMAALDQYLFARRILADGGLTLVPSFNQLAQRDDEMREAAARWLDAAYLRRVSESSSGRQALSDIATASAAGRDRRRAMFAKLDARSLGDAAPLWLGAVRDIDDVLPAQAGLFDLVVLDEASQIEQTAAAGALLRGKRAVICGDPRQLRHVSFISDDDMKRANDAHLGPQVPGLDVRRESIFDVASRAGNGFQLDEHYRCDPHLIDFSARRFYQRRLHVATATPLNHDADHIEVRFVEGGRNDKKINSAQTAAAEQIIGELISEGVRSIGIITPFRDQADAMTERILRNYRADEIEDYGISVGTVHAFQGAEHQVVVAMLTLGPEDAGSWRFVNDANLFNVMVTRARRRMIVLTSDPAPPGLAGEYLVHAEPLSRHQETIAHTRLWPSRVASALADTNLAFWPNYYVGKHRIDFAVIRNGRPTALTVEAHPDGPVAHADRELALRRLGWDAIDGFESRWGDRLGELAVTLA